MPVLSVRVADDLATRFDAAAKASGGRSAMLHRLVREAAAASVEGVHSGAAGRRDVLRLMVRLGAAEAAHVAEAATAMALPKSTWVAALVAAHTGGRPAFSRAGDLSLLAIHRELRRTGVNVNQMARALNTAVMEGRVLDTQLSGLEDLRREIREHIGALGEAFKGNLAYWEVGW